jgi:hypothetical protein
MRQHYTGMLRLRGRGAELPALLEFQRGYSLYFSASSTRWSVRRDLIKQEGAPRTDALGFATNLASTCASRHADFEGDGTLLGLGFLDLAEARFALFTITDQELVGFTDALAARGHDMLSYLTDLSSLLDAESLALGRNLDAGALHAFLRGRSADLHDVYRVCVASGVPAASERALYAHAPVREAQVHGRRVLHSQLPGHEPCLG